MNRAQPQYLIVANSRCKTHPLGTEIIHTGPRAGIPPGWNCAGRFHQSCGGGST